MIRQARSRTAALSILFSMSPALLGAQTLASPLRASIDRSAATLVLATQAAQPACDSSKAAGKQAAASRHSAAGWFIGGLGAGVGLGLIGTGILTGVSAIGNPKPKEPVPGEMEANCYIDGYSSQAKHKNMISALLGGTVGTVAWVLIYLNAHKDDNVYYY